jgi:Holliday junction resolvase RusA-like endonuclease
MYRIPIKPLSVNRSYQGRRFATPELKAYKQELTNLLPSLTIPKGKLRVKYIFGVSSKASDGDNLIKSFQDTLCEKYGINDRDIFRWEVEKKLVARGAEYAAFEIFPAHQP